MKSQDEFFKEFPAYISPNAYQTAQTFTDKTAAELVSEIKIGWNLGNTLDSIPREPNPDLTLLETSWYNPIVTLENITAIKNAGFNAIRIPVTWHKAIDENSIIRRDWMDRVTEIVNYADSLGMYIILNTHHDERIFKLGKGGIWDRVNRKGERIPATELTSEEKEESLIRFGRIWSQIAFNFQNYNEKLIFEALNEPRTLLSVAEWSGGIDFERALLNEYYELFVKIIRESGGNNDKRILMVNTYAASDKPFVVNELKVPNDNGRKKIIVSIHSYDPIGFCFPDDPAKNKWSASEAETASVHSSFDRATAAFVSKGIPVIIGEFGSVNKNNEADRAAHAEYFVSYGRQKGIPCFWWDNGALHHFKIIDRSNNSFPFPELLEALMRGAGIK